MRSAIDFERADKIKVRSAAQRNARVTNRQFLSSEEVLLRLENRLGRLHARLRLGMEREHEAQAFGQGLTFLHLENMPIMQALIEIVLRGSGTYWRGLANAAKVIVKRNLVSAAGEF